MASKVNAHDDRPHLSQRLASLGGAYASHSVATQCRDAMIEEGITSIFLMELDGNDRTRTHCWNFRAPKTVPTVGVTTPLMNGI